mgnify:CR=1 FL=1
MMNLIQFEGCTVAYLAQPGEVSFLVLDETDVGTEPIPEPTPELTSEPKK